MWEALRSFGFGRILGLIALIGIPIVIIIYILKPKYQEKTLTSTHIWKLSLKYRKRKIPLQWLKRSLLLFVQLLIVTVIAFSIAKPQTTKKTEANKYLGMERIIILDASASMSAVDGEGKSRFDKAKEQILKIATDEEASSYDNNLSIIYCGETVESHAMLFTTPVTDDKDAIKDLRQSDVSKIEYLVSTMKCSYVSADYSEAIEKAKKIKGTGDAAVFLYTDHEFEKTGFVTVVNFAKDGEWNASVSSVKEAYYSNNNFAFDVELGLFGKSGQYRFVCEITGLNGVSDETSRYYKLQYSEVINFTPDESGTAAKKKVSIRTFSNPDDNTPDGFVSEDTAEVKAYEKRRFKISSYQSARFYLENVTDDENAKKISDSYPADDEYWCFGDGGRKFSIQIKSDQSEGVTTPPYSVAAFSVITPTPVIKEISGRTVKQNLVDSRSGYDLYVYDGTTPAAVPEDGAVMFINPQVGFDYSKYGFTVGGTSALGEYEMKAAFGSELSTVLTQDLTSEFSVGSESTDKALTVTRYAEITSDTLTPVMTVDNGGEKPVIMAGEVFVDGNRLKVVVVAFDLRYSYLPLTTNLVYFARNVAEYTLVPTFYNYNYSMNASAVTGEDALSKYDNVISVAPRGNYLLTEISCDDPSVKTRVIANDNYSADVYSERLLLINKKRVAEGKEELKIDKATRDTAFSFTADKPGIYTVTQYTKDSETTDRVYVGVNEKECDIISSENFLSEELPDVDVVDSETVVKSEKVDLDVKDLTFYFAIALMALILLEWGLQYREQY